MRFFGCVISNWDNYTGYFISSERSNTGRRFTIRQANYTTGDVINVSKFQEYETLNQAKGILRKLLRESKKAC
jgi:hypothetical protein